MKKRHGFKKLYTRRLSLLAAVPIMLVGLGGCRGYFANNTVHVSCHYIYSAKLEKEITQFTRAFISSMEGCTLGDKKAHDLSLFYKELKKRFRFVKKATWKLSPTGELLVVVQGTKPSFILNDDLVMGDKKRLFPLDLFQTVTASELRTLSVNPTLLDDKMPPELYRFLQTVPDSYWNCYTITYSNDNSVLLEERDAGVRRQFIVDKASLFDRRKLHVASLVEDELIARKNVYKRKSFMKKKYVSYDLRFKDRVCARIAQGG